MALDFKILATRTLTAIAFAAIMCVGLFIPNNWIFAILVVLMQFICFREYEKLIGNIFPPFKKIHLGIRIFFYVWSLVILYILTRNYWGYTIFGEYGEIVFAIFLSLSAVFLFYYFEGFDRANIGFIMGGWLWIVIPCATLLLIRITNYQNVIVDSYYLPIVVFLTMWVNDTMAYLIGASVGKKSLSKISPKKTWEGTIGGIVCSTTMFGWFVHHMGWILGYHAYTIVFVAAFAGVWGDLFESFVKRKSNVKDTGNWLPGHGGFLDRFDSVLFAAPAVWVYLFIYQLLS